MAINQFKTVSLVSALGAVMVVSIYKTAVKAAPANTNPQLRTSFASPSKATATPRGAFTLLHSFSGMDGSGPNGGLVEAANGVIYGSTERGGKYNDGVLFRLNPDGDYIVLHDFTGASDGMCPGGLLLIGNDNAIYGKATGSSGKNNDSLTFKITPSGKYSVLSEVMDSSDTIRTIWYQQRRNGDFFALSHPPAVGSKEQFFEMSGSMVPDPFFKLVFGQSEYIPLRGAQWLTLPDKHGNTFMMLPSSSNPKGQIVEFSHSSSKPTILYSFSGPDGNNPRSFIKGSDGSFHGTTSLGGADNKGVVFKWTPANPKSRFTDK